MELSKSFTLNELTKSQEALRLGIDNTPNDEHIENLKILCENILQPIRDFYGMPVSVSSGYRSAELCKAIGSSSTSQHTRGDYVCCIMARTIGEAIEKTEKIALNQQGAQHIKIMGISNGREEWLNEDSPLVTNEEEYTRQINALFERIKNNKAA